MTQTLGVLSPVAPDEDIPQIAATATLRKFQGARIAILNNIKPGADMLQPYLEKELRKRIPDVEIKSWRVPFSTPQPEKDLMLAEIAEFADGVIAGVGD